SCTATLLASDQIKCQPVAAPVTLAQTVLLEAARSKEVFGVEQSLAYVATVSGGAWGNIDDNNATALDVNIFREAISRALAEFAERTPARDSPAGTDLDRTE